MTTTKKHGEMQWTETAFGANDNRQNGKDVFLKLSPGSNIVRLLTLPFQYFQHKYKFSAEEKGFGHRIYCSGAHGSCAVCAKGDKAKRRWLLGVIDRKSNSYRILDISWGVLKSLTTLHADSDWGDPINYDIDIVVDPKAGSVGYYNVVAKPPRPLSAQDLLIKESKVDIADLERRTSAPLPERTEERFKKLMDEFMQSNPSSSLAQEADDDADFTNADAAGNDNIPF